MATATPSPTASAPSSPIAAGSAEIAVYAEIQSQVEKLRDLPAAPAGVPVLLDQAGIRDWMTKAYSKVDHVAYAAESRLFARLGLLEEGASIEKLEADLNSGQAIGFYDTESKQLFLLSESGGVGAMQKLTFSHEYTHAMQDHQFDLTKLGLDEADQSDRNLARTALVEGDASLAMTQWAQTHMSIADLLAVSLSEDSAAQAAQLEAAPAILRENLLFPYTEGLTFVRGVYASGGWPAVDRAYAQPPSSTAQILHPDLYFKGVAPVAVPLPYVPLALGNGWKLSFQDTMGELQLRVWLEGKGPTSGRRSVAADAAAGWAGDRIGLYEGPNGAWVVMLRTQWRTAADEAGFQSAAGSVLSGLKYPSSECLSSADGMSHDIYIASDQALIAAFSSCKSPAESASPAP
jgi:hypothetical protein